VLIVLVAQHPAKSESNWSALPVADLDQSTSACEDFGG
jgi:hypothetical protein